MKGVIKKLLSMPKSRIVIGLMCILFIAGFLMNSCSSSSEINKGQPMNSSIENTPLNLQQNNSIPVSNYQQKLQRYNSDQYNQAAITGKSYFQRPDGRVNNMASAQSQLIDHHDKSHTDKADKKGMPEKSPVDKSIKADPKQSTLLQINQQLNHVSDEDQTTAIERRSQEDLDAVYNKPLNNEQAEQLYQKDVQGVVSGWANKSQMAMTQSPKDSSGNMSDNTSHLDKSILVKAGYIGFAVIDTSVNSDQVGTPVLAHIVEGPLKGAKLLGGFTREGDYIVVKFNLMSMPSREHSIAINAYAVDGSTAQIALASDVNHHYIERYGSLFAAAFLQGFGTYFSNQNQNQQICLSGQSGGILPCFNVNNNNQPTVRSAAFSGLGQVGTALSANMASIFNRPPTVKLYQGTGVGILFTNDVSA
ncbi:MULTISPECIES: DotG/IcmE/VirB10 family protein [Cysteiniphilum]|uniref:DotG/IcmE/VirB10 family protein n=1 Tax=Cysteiniphilum TaxID=2056696 RepID=UPI00177EC145|nr:MULTISPECIES: DotG/IcmE/VirB10 family protein [Cysteiniphilum]